MFQHARRVPPGVAHNHHNPTVSEILYLYARYYVRNYCAERRNTVRVQAYTEVLVARFELQAQFLS